MKHLKGKTALLTGGSMGLGPHIARSLAAEGVNLALTARSKDKLEAVAKELGKFGAKVATFPADITNEDDRLEMVNAVKEELGPIDLLINNAGVEWVSAFIDLTKDDIDKLLHTNLVSPIMMARIILPEMIMRDSGHIVMMASLGGKKGQPYSAPYAATKAGLIAWTSSVRAELHNTNVSASVICPGFVSDSGMFAVYNKKAPKISGESKPEKVAKAVITAIKKDKQEIIVNPNSILPMMLLDAFNPKIMTAVFRKTGLHEFYRLQAEDNKKLRHQKN